MILSRDTDAQQGLFIILFLMEFQGPVKPRLVMAIAVIDYGKSYLNLRRLGVQSRDFGLREASGYE
jgi:hypothetical protein